MKNGEKASGEILAIFGLFTVLIVLNFLIVHSFADECSSADQICVEGLNPWYVFFMRFQTLITGVLAVGAATATILEMRRGVAKSEQIHREQQALLVTDKLEAIIARKSVIDYYLSRAEPAMQECVDLYANALEQNVLPRNVLTVYDNVLNDLEEIYPADNIELIGPIYVSACEGINVQITAMRRMYTSTTRAMELAPAEEYWHAPAFGFVRENMETIMRGSLEPMRNERNLLLDIYTRTRASFSGQHE